MAVHGSLRTMPLAEVLSWVQATQRSGTLGIERDGNEWELRLELGRVVGYVGPEMRDDSLGHVVVTSGLLTEEDLRGALQAIRSAEHSLMRVLVTEGFLTADHLQECLRELATESLHDLFLDLPGDFVYSDASEQGLFALEDSERFVSIDVGVNELLLEGATRQDEWEMMRTRFPTENIRVQIVDEKLPPIESLGVRQRRIVASLAAGQSISDICIEMRAPLPSVLLGLSSLINDGAVVIRKRRSDEPGDSDPGRINRLVEQAVLLRESGQFDEAVSLLGAAVRMRPDDERVRQRLREALEEQIRDLYESLPPHRVPRLIVSDARLQRLKLRPDERFVVDRLAAKMDIGSLIMVSSLNERETLKLLRRLLHGEIIELG
ncbi:MAG: DUF4388 domain-containing protein [Myxococcota bacterium]